MSGRFALPRKDFPEADGSTMSHARKGLGERAPSPLSRSVNSSYRSRSPQPSRASRSSQGVQGSFSLTNGRTNQDTISELWHEKLRNRKRDPSEDRTNQLVKQFTSELSKETKWVSNLGKSRNADSQLLRSAKQRIFALTQKWALAEKEALSIINAVGREISSAKSDISALSDRISEKEQTINAVTNMTSILSEKLLDLENEAYSLGIYWERPTPPRRAARLNGGRDADQYRNTDIDTFSISSEPVGDSTRRSYRDLSWASSPIQRPQIKRRGSEGQRPSTADSAQPRGRSQSPAPMRPSPTPSRRDPSPGRGRQPAGNTATHNRPWRGGGIATAGLPRNKVIGRSPALDRLESMEEDVVGYNQENQSEFAFSESLNSPYADDHRAYFERKRNSATDEFYRIRQEQLERLQQQVPQNQEPLHANSPSNSVYVYDTMNAKSPGPYVNRWADESADDMFGPERTSAAPPSSQIDPVQTNAAPRRIYENDDLQKLAEEYDNAQGQAFTIPRLEFNSYNKVKPEQSSSRGPVTTSFLKGYPSSQNGDPVAHAVNVDKRRYA